MNPDKFKSLQIEDPARQKTTSTRSSQTQRTRHIAGELYSQLWLLIELKGIHCMLTWESISVSRYRTVILGLKDPH